MKETIYYDEMCLPNQIRIVSEMLCLDHTFSPGASKTPIGYNELLDLIENPLIEQVSINMGIGTAYILNIDNKLESLEGWIDISKSCFLLKDVKSFIPS